MLFYWYRVQCRVWIVVTMMRGCGLEEDGSDVWAGVGRDGCSFVCSLHSGVYTVKCTVYSVQCDLCSGQCKL